MKGNAFSVLIATERRKRHLSQDAVCELIGVADASTLSKWENGVVAPNQQVVIKLMTLYNNPMIGLLYLTEWNEVGSTILSDVLLTDQKDLALSFQTNYEDISNVRREILNFAIDGMVNEDKASIWGECKKQINKFLGVLLPLYLVIFNENKMPLQGGNLVRA